MLNGVDKGKVIYRALVLLQVAICCALVVDGFAVKLLSETVTKRQPVIVSPYITDHTVLQRFNTNAPSKSIPILSGFGKEDPPDAGNQDAALPTLTKSLIYLLGVAYDLSGKNSTASIDYKDSRVPITVSLDDCSTGKPICNYIEDGHFVVDIKPRSILVLDVASMQTQEVTFDITLSDDGGIRSLAEAIEKSRQDRTKPREDKVIFVPRLPNSYWMPYKAPERIE